MKKRRFQLSPEAQPLGSGLPSPQVPGVDHRRLILLLTKMALRTLQVPDVPTLSRGESTSVGSRRLNKQVHHTGKPQKTRK